MTTESSRSGSTDHHVRSLFVGRAAELTLLRKRLNDALAQRGRLVLVTGEAGIGKTRLARELLAVARYQQAGTLEGVCYPTRRAASFGPFVGALRQALREASEIQIEPVWREALQPLLPELGYTCAAASNSSRPVSEHEDSWRFEAFYQAFRAVAQGRGLVLLIEDLQWADRASLELLRYVGRGVEREPILLLGTIRDDQQHADDDPGDLLAALARLPLAEELALRPLDLEATTELLGFRVPDLNGENLGRLARLVLDQTRGNAFFVDELVSWLGEPGRADRALADDGALALELPRSVREAIAARIGCISEDGRSLLTWAAVLGREFDFPLLAHLLGDGSTALRSLRELIDRQLVAPALDGERFVFRHPIVREAVYSHLLAPQRRARHRSAAEAIEVVHANELAPHLAELAEHHLAAGASDQACEYMLRAGEWAVQVQAYADAVTHFECALRLWPLRSQSQRRLTVLEALAGSALRAGRIAEADRLLRELLESHLAEDDPRAAVRIRAELAHACYYAGAWEEGLAHCQAGLAMLDGLEAHAERIDLLNGRARLRQLAGDLASALADSRAALAEAEQLSDDRRVAEAAIMLTYGHALLGNPAEAQAIGQRGLRAAERTGDVHLKSDLLCAMGFVYGNVQQELARGEALLLWALELARQFGQRHQEARIMSLLSYCVAIPRGEWVRAEALVRDCLAIADRIGLRDLRWTALSYLGMLTAARGKHAVARATFEQVINASGGQGLYAWVSRYEIGGLLLREGRTREAIEILEASLKDQLRSIGPIWTSRLAEAYFLAGKREDASTWSARSLEASRRTGRVFDTLEAERVAALIGAADGATAGAVATLEATVARLAQIGRPADWGRHARDLAELLCRSGSTRDFARANSLLSDVQATFSRLGARQELAVTRAVAGRYGLALPSLAVHSIGDPELDRISARGQEVAAAVGRGMSNREIAERLVVSERTVEWHVSNVLGKLGLRSRTQLATWAVEHGLVRDASRDRGASSHRI